MRQRSKLLQSPNVKDKLAALSTIAVWNPSEEFASYVKNEIERGKVVAATGLKIK